MDIMELVGSLLDATLTFILDLVLGGLFNFLSDLLFGGPAQSII